MVLADLVPKQGWMVACGAFQPYDNLYRQYAWAYSETHCALQTTNSAKDYVAEHGDS